ncbi:MAG: hypothetical protein ACT4N5_00505 [Nitrosopumilaceae archaeon]
MKKLFNFVIYLGIFLTSIIIGLFLIANYDLEKCDTVCQNELEKKNSKKSESEKETFVKISLEKFPPGQKVNHQLANFTIILEGYYPTINAPDVKLENDEGNIIWSNYDDIDHVYFDRTSPTEFCKVYYFNDIGGPLIINKTGTYNMIFSFEKFYIEKQLVVLQSTSSVSLDKPDFHCP